MEPSLREKKTSAELKDRMGIVANGGVLKRKTMRWFGYMEKQGQRRGQERLSWKWFCLEEEDCGGYPGLPGAPLRFFPG